MIIFSSRWCYQVDKGLVSGSTSLQTVFTSKWHKTPNASNTYCLNLQNCHEMLSSTILNVQMTM